MADLKTFEDIILYRLLEDLVPRPSSEHLIDKWESFIDKEFRKGIFFRGGIYACLKDLGKSSHATFLSEFYSDQKNINIVVNLDVFSNKYVYAKKNFHNVLEKWYHIIKSARFYFLKFLNDYAKKKGTDVLSIITILEQKSPEYSDIKKKLVSNLIA